MDGGTVYIDSFGAVFSNPDGTLSRYVGYKDETVVCRVTYEWVSHAPVEHRYSHGRCHKSFMDVVRGRPCPNMECSKNPLGRSCDKSGQVKMYRCGRAEVLGMDRDIGQVIDQLRNGATGDDMWVGELNEKQKEIASRTVIR